MDVMFLGKPTAYWQRLEAEAEQRRIHNEERRAHAEKVRAVAHILPGGRLPFTSNLTAAEFIVRHHKAILEALA